jgi:hypothetical protein
LQKRGRPPDVRGSFAGAMPASAGCSVSSPQCRNHLICELEFLTIEPRTRKHPSRRRPLAFNLNRLIRRGRFAIRSSVRRFKNEVEVGKPGAPLREALLLLRLLASCFLFRRCLLRCLLGLLHHSCPPSHHDGGGGTVPAGIASTASRLLQDTKKNTVLA